MADAQTATDVTFGDGESISPIIRPAVERDWDPMSPVASCVYWRHRSGECRHGRRPFGIFWKPFVLRRPQDAAEAVAPLCVRMPVRGGGGAVVVANLVVRCAGDAAAVLQSLGTDSPDHELRLWFARWIDAAVSNKGVRALLERFADADYRKHLEGSLFDRLRYETGLAAGGALSLAGESAGLPVAMELKCDLACHVKGCPSRVKFRLDAGLTRGSRTGPGMHSRIVADMQRPISNVAEQFMIGDVTVDRLGDGSFGSVSGAIQSLAEEQLLVPLGLKFAWFDLVPVFGMTLSANDESAYETADGAAVELAWSVQAGCVAEGSLGGPHADSRETLLALVGGAISSEIGKMQSRAVFLNWDRPGRSVAAVRRRLDSAVRRQVAAAGFAAVTSLDLLLRKAEWVQMFKEYRSRVFEVPRVAVLPGNVPIDLHYGFRFRVLDVCDKAFEQMSFRLPPEDEVRREVETKFRTVLLGLIGAMHNEPISAGVKLDEIQRQVNIALEPPGLGLKVQLEDLLRYPTEVERYECDVRRRTLLDKIAQMGEVADEFRGQKLLLEKDVAQLVAGGLSKSDAYAQKSESLREIDEHLKRREADIQGVHAKLSTVEAHLRLIEEARTKGSGIDGTLGGIPLKENGEPLA